MPRCGSRSFPGGIGLVAACIWMPALWVVPDPWRWFTILGTIATQFWVTIALLHRACWPARCRAMAALGFEVCPRCGYPQRDAPPGVRTCSECGGRRIDPPRGAPLDG